MSEPATEADFNKTFAALQQASEPGAQGGVCLAHMWEFYFGEDQKKPRQLRNFEIDQVLKVMADKPYALYEDEEGFRTRRQRGHKDGFIGLASSAIFKGVPLGLFDFNGQHTGLLLLNPTPVLVSSTDCHSKYYDTHPDRLQVIFGKHAAGNQDLIGLQQLHTSGPPDERTSVDPHDTGVQQRALKAYRHLGQSYLDGTRQPPERGATEICANARLEQIGGIIAHVSSKELDLSSQGWAERLAANPDLAPLLHEAILDYKRVAATMERHGVAHRPTIMIYQHHNKDPQKQQLHFPPTRENIALVERALRAKPRNPRLGPDNSGSPGLP
jgi:hypothetical protein